jgi:hypothetical protein
MSGCTSFLRCLVPTSSYAWIFPPVRLLADMMVALKIYKTNAILVVPQAEATNWWIALQEIGKVAHLSEPLVLDRSSDVCIQSRRVPRGTINPAFYNLRAYRLTW